ncbi:MAG TPA: hypothetical protein VL988_13790 [Solirubrobacteraceae bacterium]|nr:hypothetical protein [Solirubrobacteraceae bacterium]
MLATYLNDHLAGATAGRELARRAAASNQGSLLGDFLEGLAVEIDEDRDALLALMAALDVGVDRFKVLGGWTVEKLGRLKLNGRLFGYSPLSRLLELEALALGVAGKLGLWQALEELALPERAIAGVDLPDLQERAERQLEQLERNRLDAAPEALGA